MLYALMVDDARTGGHDARRAVDDVLDAYDQAPHDGPDESGAAVGAPEPDPETWGLLPHQIARAEAAQRLIGGVE